LSAERIALLKQTAVFVNISCGKVVGEPALARALAEGRIMGAALDASVGEAMKLGTRDVHGARRSEKIAKRTFIPPPSPGPGITSSRNMPIDFAARCHLPDLQFAEFFSPNKL
jgi:hypothetical protein